MIETRRDDQAGQTTTEMLKPQWVRPSYDVVSLQQTLNDGNGQIDDSPASHS